MVDNGVEILLVEDNPNDEMLALHAFKRQNIVNKVHVVRDGAEALEYVFCTGAYADRQIENPKVILLDLKLPLVDGMEVLRQMRADPRTRMIPWWCSPRRTKSATSSRPTSWGSTVTSSSRSTSNSSTR